jgi:gluconolactonase
MTSQEPTYIVKDPRFARLIIGHARLDQLWTGCRWAEGPVHVPAAKCLIWSDIPNDRLLRYDEPTGAVTVWQSPCGNHNGHTLDRDGRIVACEHLARRVSRLDPDGRWQTVADAVDGKRLNAPNDVIVKSDGSIWFSDPTYGIDSDYEGRRSPSEIGACNVYRVDPSTGAVAAVVTDMVRPNGLAFSPDETKLYVADTGISHDAAVSPDIRVYDVAPDGATLGAGRCFATCPSGVFDGFRVDEFGNLWCSSDAGVLCYAPDGAELGLIPVPETVANVEFGGEKRNRLYITAKTSLYAIYVAVRGDDRLRRA